MTVESLERELRAMRNRIWQVAVPLVFAVVGASGFVYRVQADAEEAQKRVEAVEKRMQERERAAAEAERRLESLRRQQNQHSKVLNWIGESVERIARNQGTDLPPRPVVPTED